MLHRNENTGKGNGFYEEQQELMKHALQATTPGETKRLIEKAQWTAASRSPSRRPSRASSPARSDASDYSYSGAWGRDPTSISYRDCYHDDSRVVRVTEGMPIIAEPVKHLARASSPPCSAASAYDTYSCDSAWERDPSGISYRDYCNHDISGVAGVMEVTQVSSEPVIYCSSAPMGGLQLPPLIPGVYPSTVPTSEPAGLPS